jgi:DNA-binding NarL/FixJ family response regulator
VLTTFDLDEYVYEALQAGASGFLLKDIAPRALIEAVQTIVAGEAMLSPRISRRLIKAYTETRPAPTVPPALSALTPRELEVAITVAEGLSHAMAKLALPNRTKLALLVHDAGLA